MKKYIVMAASGALVGGLLLGGCSQGADWTLNGQKVEDLEGSIRLMDHQWRVAAAAGGRRLTLPSDAGCYFQVMEGGVLENTVICGPVRYLGDKTSSWQSASVVAEADGERRLVLDPNAEGAFQLGAKPRPGAEVLRPDLRRANLEQQLDEPDPPQAKVGDALLLPGDVASMQVVRLRSGSANYDLRVGLVTGRLGEGESTVAPPSGGAFVVAAADAEPSGFPETEMAHAEFILSVDGVESTLPLLGDVGDGVGGTRAVAVPSGTGRLLVGLKQDGLTQFVDVSSGTRVSGPADGYYDGIGDKADASCEKIETGDSDQGWSRSFNCSVEGRRVVFRDPTMTDGLVSSSWPAPGHVFVEVMIKPIYGATWSPEKFATHATYLSRFAVKNPVLTVDGKRHLPVSKVMLQSSGYSSGNLRVLFEVPAGRAEAVLQAKVEMTDTLDWSLRSAPQSGTATFPIKVPITFS